MTKEEIVAQATAMFVREGCRRVTMDSVASELHVSKRTLYELFKDKKELVEAVLIGIKGCKLIQMEQYNKIIRDNRQNELYIMMFMMGNYKRFMSAYFLLLEDVRMTYPDLMEKLFIPNEKALEKELEKNLDSMDRAGYIREGLNKKFAAWILAQFVVKPLSSQRHSYEDNTSVACEASLIYIRGLLRTEYLNEYDRQEPAIRALFNQADA